MIGLRSLSTQLSGAQVGITVTTLALGFVMQPALASLIAGPLEAIGLSEGASQTVGLLFGLSVATVLSMVFGELVPKSIAIAEPLETAKTVITPMRISTMLFKPLIVVLNGTANLVLKLIGVEPQEELRSARSAVELDSLVRRSAAQGTLEKPTAGLLARSISFSGKTADDVLTPRVRVRFVKATDTAEAVLVAAAETGHSRFPVSGEDSDDVIGLVHLKRAVAIPPEDRSGVRVDQLTVPVPIVPGSMPLDDLLDQLRGPRPADGRRRRRVRRHRRDPHARGRRRGAGRRDQGRARPGRRPRGVPLRRHLVAARIAAPGRDRRDHRGAPAGVGRLRNGGRAADLQAGPDAGELRLGRGVGHHGRLVDARVSRTARSARPDDRADRPVTPSDDLPRAVTVRLTVHRRARRRIDTW